MITSESPVGPFQPQEVKWHTRETSTTTLAGTERQSCHSVGRSFSHLAWQPKAPMLSTKEVAVASWAAGHSRPSWSWPASHSCTLWDMIIQKPEPECIEGGGVFAAPRGTPGCCSRFTITVPLPQTTLKDRGQPSGNKRAGAPLYSGWNTEHIIPLPCLSPLSGPPLRRISQTYSVKCSIIAVTEPWNSSLCLLLLIKCCKRIKLFYRKSAVD